MSFAFFRYSCKFEAYFSKWPCIAMYDEEPIIHFVPQNIVLGRGICDTKILTSTHCDYPLLSCGRIQFGT